VAGLGYKTNIFLDNDTISGFLSILVQPILFWVYGLTQKYGFVTATKLGTTINFLFLQPKILLQQPNVLLTEPNILL